jgi:hypothetical protein
MTSTATGRPGRVYTIACEAGRRYVIYNASEIGNPPDHVPDKWYFQRYPAGLSLAAGEPFDTAEAAERAALASDERLRAEAKGA